MVVQILYRETEGVKEIFQFVETPRDWFSYFDDTIWESQDFLIPQNIFRTTKAALAAWVVS